MLSLQVDLISAFTDNYLFSVRQGEQKSCSIIDPGDAESIIQYLEKNQLTLDAIYITHHHMDHCGGAKQLQTKYGVKIFGPSSIYPDVILKEDSTFKIFDKEFQVMELPGHTLDHLAFFQKEDLMLFCGDVIFSYGCGRLFEGSHEQMFHSLNRLKNLPDKTKIYCAHEYTLHNLNFTLSYLTEKENFPYVELKQKLLETRAMNKPSIPSSLEFEKKYNLFLKASTCEEFKKVREARNNF